MKVKVEQHGGKGNRIASPSSAQSGGDWSDESGIVDCPCGVNFDDGEEMVQCDECGVWVHTSCCGVKKELPTYMCDKCKHKKMLNDSKKYEVPQSLADILSEEESGVAELLAHEFPSKIVSFEERNHECVLPKLLKLEYKELPKPREKILKFLGDLEEMGIPMYFDTGEKCVHSKSGQTRKSEGKSKKHKHKQAMKVDKHHHHDKRARDGCKKQSSKKKPRTNNDIHRLIDRKHKPTVKEDKHHHHSKRARDECKEQSSEKKPRTNDDIHRPIVHKDKQMAKEDKHHHHGKRVGDECEEQSSKKKPQPNDDIHRPVDGDAKKMDVAPSHETSLLSKSTPKSPKETKKLAGQEFIDGDVMILCSMCNEPLLGGSTWGALGGSDLFCQECEKPGCRNSPLSAKQETIGAMKQEPIFVPPAPSVINSRITFSPLKDPYESCEQLCNLLMSST